MKKTFSIKEVFKKGFELTKKHIVFLASATFIYFVVYYILTKMGRGPGSLLITIASAIVSLIFSMGLYKAVLKVASDVAPSTDDFMPETSVALSFIWATIIFCFFAFVGTLLLVIPGIIVILRLSLVYYFVIDKKIKGWDATKASWEATKGYSWSMLGFFVCSIIISIIASIPFGLGLILSVPFVATTHAIIYKTIMSKKDIAVVPESQAAVPVV